MRNQKSENQIKSNDRDETGKNIYIKDKKTKQLEIKRMRIILYKKRNKRKLVYFNKEKNTEKWKVKKKKIHWSHIIHLLPPQVAPLESSQCVPSNAAAEHGV